MSSDYYGGIAGEMADGKLHLCGTPGCGRLVEALPVYCCAPCASAHATGSGLEPYKPRGRAALHHTEPCERRHLARTQVGDPRTGTERARDMALYGSCPVCGTARAGTVAATPGGDVTYTMICPSGHDPDAADAADLARLLEADDGR